MRNKACSVASTNNNLKVTVPEFGLSFMISSLAHNRSSTFYAYLVIKIGNRNLDVYDTDNKQFWIQDNNHYSAKTIHMVDMIFDDIFMVWTHRENIKRIY